MKKTSTSFFVAGLLVLTPTIVSLTPAAAHADPTPASSNAALTCEGTSPLTVLATTDLHGTVLNHDYFTGKPFTDSKPDQRNRTRGLELLSPAISDVRAKQGADSVVLLDNGDANQGSPLSIVYHASRTSETADPMASALNYLGYDAGVVGNHEFNYGHLDRDGKRGDLNQYRDSLTMPLLGANVIDRATGAPYFDPYTIITKRVDGKNVKVGVIGVVTPGVRIWDRNSTQDLRFQDAVEAVQQWVPKVREAGADVVVVLAHTGMDAPGYQWNPADLSENVAQSIATHTSGVDVVVAGHSHVTNNVETRVTNAAGKNVLITQPGYHARFLSDVTIPLSFSGDKPAVVNNDHCAPSAAPLYASDYLGREDAGLREAIAPWHQETVDWVSTVVAQATDDMTAERSRYEDTPIEDFINLVQQQAVERGLKGTEYEGLPVLSQASPFSASAHFTKGDVTIADMAGLYVFDNTLFGVEMTGKQVKDYLEWSARYYVQQPEGASIEDWSKVTNARYEGDTRGLPDYTYDMLAGVNYHINISKPVGDRIENLSYPNGKPVGDDDRFILAVNNYRQSGGSGYPHVSSAKVVYDKQEAIRELLIDWAKENKVLDPAKLFTLNWDVSPSVAPAPGVNANDEPAAGSSAPAAGPGAVSAAPSSVGHGVGTGVASTPTPAGSAPVVARVQAPATSKSGQPKAVEAGGHRELAYSGSAVGLVGTLTVALLVGGAAVLIGRRRVSEKY